MKEMLYLEIPTPEIADVRTWLHRHFVPEFGEKSLTPDGFRLTFPIISTGKAGELSIFTWWLQRTTYLKVFQVGEVPKSARKAILAQLQQQLRQQFPHHYPEPPGIDLAQQSIFAALADQYPLTVKYFQKIPNGEYDLKRVYWWEKRWREGVRQPQQPHQVVLTDLTPTSERPGYDLIYIGGALGVIHAAVMARLGYRVLLLERLPFGRMNREWNISRSELQSLIDLRLFSRAEIDSFVAREYKDGFHKFFDANNPSVAQAPVLHTPTVLNVALDTGKLLQLCGEKLRQAGGKIWDETEFTQVRINPQIVSVEATHLPTQNQRVATGRLLVDAMGTASPIAWQLNGDRTFNSVCPTVGAVIERGFEPEVWDADYGDVLNSHGDISRGRQLIWELFPGADQELTVYLFHYHQVNPENPGSLLEMYEDFFTILPEYRRCDLDKLVWRKATFGYIPGHFSMHGGDRRVAWDRLITIGDAASLQSPLVFTGFGSLVRNLSRLTDLLDTALKHDLLKARSLNQIRAYQSNVAVTWLFSKGMMVPIGRYLPPAKINSILNTFFGILAEESTEIADTFIKDRVGWWTFTRLALKAARINPQLLIWILDFVTPGEVIRWVLSYLNFTVFALISWLFAWLPGFARWLQPWLEPRFPGVWLWLLSRSYAVTDGMGKPQPFNHRRLSPKVVPEG
ncbi:MAG: flavin-dependent dehydrogenase [Oscillatoriales cyanobacterium RM2_1_1]|nr:flavin-dependent dehydrogenase [Oscillatoriales cyanobacterium SM2_3_0]NJO45606.1 flavin-dependent dehydrogenase [Oscillatoriales cyanobacterium RM2_1_1]